MTYFSKKLGDAVDRRRMKTAKLDAGRHFRGVQRKPSGRYEAKIWVPSLRCNVGLGTFDSAEEAAKAYHAAAVELHGCTPAEAEKKKMAAALDLKAWTPGWAAKKKITAARSDAWTEFRGVYRTPNGKYGAQIRQSRAKARMWLGTFDAAEDAARVYDDAAVRLHGARAVTNFKQPRETKKKAAPRPDAWTEFRGVYQKFNGKYAAQISGSRGKARTWLGSFDAAEDAARAYDEAAVKMHGARAVTNFRQPRMEKEADQVPRRKRSVRGKNGAQIGHSKTKASRTWLGTFGNGDEASRAYDSAAVRLLGAAAETNFDQPPTGAAADDVEDSPMGLLNNFPEMPTLDFLSHSVISAAQLDDHWADLPGPEQQLVDEFLNDTDFSDVAT